MKKQHICGYLRTRGALTAGMTAIVLAAGITACSSGSSSPGVASAGTPSSKASSSAKPSGMLAYSRCMRSHGVPNFPDPNSQGIIRYSNQGGDTAALQKAQQECKSLAPPGTAAPGQQQSQQDKAKALKYSECMRTHGFPNFPDPSSSGAISFGGNSGMDPRSPQFQSASKTCSKISGFVAVNGTP